MTNNRVRVQPTPSKSRTTIRSSTTCSGARISPRHWRARSVLSQARESPPSTGGAARRDDVRGDVLAAPPQRRLRVVDINAWETDYAEGPLAALVSKVAEAEPEPLRRQKLKNAGIEVLKVALPAARGVSRPQPAAGQIPRGGSRPGRLRRGLSGGRGNRAQQEDCRKRATSRSGLWDIVERV